MNSQLRLSFPSAGVLAAVLLLPLSAGAEKEPGPAVPPPAGDAAGESSPKAAPGKGLEDALAKLDLPGVKINIKERCVDVESTVCLDRGALELIACTRDTKEHESVIMIEALPKHVHTALLLIGARPGNPAMRKAINEEGTRWIDVPPRGHPVDVFLVYKNDDGKVVERPISDFLIPSDGEGSGAAGPEPGEKFPTHTFLFAGSIIHGEGEGPRKYLADMSGHVITIATFGDELLGLPGIHSHANGALMWQVDSETIPAVGSKLTLRLRPQFRPAPPKGPGPEKGSPAG